jgi:hypothetical protein
MQPLFHNRKEKVFSADSKKKGGGLGVIARNFFRRRRNRYAVYFLIVSAALYLISGPLLFKDFVQYLKPHEAKASWYYTGGNWGYRKNITIDHTKVSGDQTNFPLLVSFTDATFKTTGNNGYVTNASGYDIIFTGSDGTTRLDHEIEKYDAATGQVVIWVRIPTLSSATDTLINIYYGNPSITTSQENKTGVWDSNFKGVWHLNQNPGGTAPQMTDSTSGGNNGTSSGSMNSGNQVTGKDDGATSFDGSDDYVNFTRPSSVTSSLSICLWAKWTTTGTTIGSIQALVDNAHSGLPQGFIMQDRPDLSKHLTFSVHPDNNNLQSTTVVGNGNWRYVCGTNDGITSRLYVDGVLDGSAAETPVTYQPAITLGYWQGGSRFLNGSLDEVRLSDTARSAGWIATEYANQSNPGSFYTLSSEAKGFPSTWTYRKAVTVTNGNAGALTAFQIKLSIDTSTPINAGKMRSDCGDLRFATSDGTSIPYWIESSNCNSTAASVWVKVPTLAAGSNTIYMYYGNANAVTAASSGSSIFEYFDDFSTDTSANYTVLNGATKAYSAANKCLMQTNVATDQHWLIANTDSLPSAYVYEAKVKIVADTATRNHGGLVTDFSSSAITGYRATHLDSSYIVSGWINGTETGIVGFSDGGIYADDTWITNRIYRDRSSGFIRYEATDGTTTLGNQGTDTSITSGHIGLHSYGDQVWIKDIKVYKYATSTPSASVVPTETNIAIDHLVVTANSGSMTVGSSQTITVTAKSSDGTTSAYTGERLLVFSGAYASPVGSNPTCANSYAANKNFGVATSVYFQNGVATTAFKPYKAETAIINATDQTDGFNANGNTASITVSAAGLNSLTATAPSSTYNGTAFSVSVAGADIYGNANSVSGTTAVGVSSGSIVPSAVPEIQKYAAPDGQQFAYEKDIKITNSLSTDLTNFQVKLALDTTGVSQTSTCNDMRFSMTNNVNIPYWVETACNSATTTVWVKVPLLAANSDTTIYWYYGNTTATSASSGSGVFEFFDDFDTNTIGSRWTVAKMSDAFYLPSVYTIENGGAHISQPTTRDTGAYFLSTSAVGSNVVTHVDYSFSSLAGRTPPWHYVRFGYSTSAIYAIGYWGGIQGGFDPAYPSDSLSFDYNNATTSNNIVISRSGTTVFTGSADFGTAQNAFFGVRTAGSETINAYFNRIYVRKYASASPSPVVQTTSSSTSLANSYTANYTITGAAGGNDTITFTNGSITKNVTIYVDVLDHYNLTVANATPAAGAPDDLTVTAVGLSGNTYPLNGANSIALSGPGNSPGGTAPTCGGTALGSRSASFANGVYSCALIMYKAENIAVTASDGTHSGATSNITISPGNVASLAFGSGSYSSTSGSPFAAVIYAKDAYGNVTTNASPSVTLSVGSGGSVSPTPITATNGAYSGTPTINNIYTTQAVTLTAAYNSLTATTSVSVTGVDVMDHFTATSNSYSFAAGGSATITVTAIGKSGNTYSGYTGSHDITLSGPSSSPGGNVPTCAGSGFASHAVTFSSGTYSCALALYKSESIGVTASDGNYSATTSSITVAPNSIASLAFGSGTYSSVSGGSFAVTLFAKDTYGNITTNANPDVALTVDKGAVSPASVTANNGTYSGTPTINNIYTTQAVTLTATYNLITTIASVTVTGVDAMDHFTATSSNYSPTAGGSATLTVTAIGRSGSTYAGYTGSHNITLSGPSSSPGGTAPTCAGTALGSRSVSFSGGAYSCVLVLYKTETIAVTANDGTYSADTPSITVAPAAVASLAFASSTYSSTSASSFSATLTAKDTYGNITTNASPDVALTVDQGTISPTSVTATNGAYSGTPTISNIYVSDTVTLTATYNSITTTTSVSVTGVDVMDHFTTTSSDYSPAAGGSSILTVTAVGKSGSTYTGYTGNHTLTLSGPGNSSAGNTPTCAGMALGSRSAAFSSGVYSCSLVLYKAETVTVTAAAGTYSDDTPSITVAPAGISSLDLSAPANATSETPFSVTFTTQDIYGNVTPDVSQAVALSVDHGASVGPVSLASSNFTDDGTYTVDVTISQVYVDDSVTLTASTNSETITTTATVAMSGVDHMDHFTLTGSSVHTAGVAKPLTVTAIGKSGSKYAQYTGNHTLTFSGVSASPLGHNPSCAGTAFGTATSLSFATGTATCSLLLYKAEPASVINVSENAYNADSHTLSVNVSPSSFSSLSITAPSSVYKDVSFNVEVVGKDTYGNALSSVPGPTSVRVSSGTVVPASLPSIPYSGSFIIYSASNDNATLTFQNGSVTQEYPLSIGDKLTDHSFNTDILVTQVVSSEITISNPANVIMSPAIAGMTGGTANGGATWTVKTNNAAGFIMKIKASTGPALTATGGSFADYTQTLDGTPDFAWGIDNDASEFGYTVEPSVPADTYSSFKDDGNACNAGFLNTADKCWAAFNTDDATILSRFSSTDAQGEDVAVIMRAQSGPGHYQISGDYQATITVTALAN